MGISAAVRGNSLVKWIYFAGPALCYAALIFFLSSFSKFPEGLPSFSGFDKIIHFIEYFIFGVLLYRWFSNLDDFNVRGRAVTTTIFIGILYALTDEWHQAFVPGRDSSLGDALFDSMGVLSASFSFPFLMSRVKKI
jgi:VanZ family protein